MLKINRWRKRVVLLLILLLTAGLCGCGDQGQDAVSQIKEMLDETRPPEVESVSEGKYAYELLDDETKKVYDEIVYTIQNREDKVRISTKEVGTMERAYEAVRSDYCNFFWLEQFSYVTTYRKDDEVAAIDITPAYAMTAEEQASIQEQIDAEADRMLAGITAESSDYEKALHIYETLIMNVDYDEESENNQNLISVFINHRTVCQGYAYAAQYLLERVGIPCTTVVGTAENESHAWNLIMLDGEYYYMDVTWGNSQYSYHTDEEPPEDENKYIDYDYFAATTEEIMATHVPDGKMELPTCTAMEDNYYVREGRYFSEWDPDAVGQLIRAAYENGDAQVQVKFSDVELYEQAIQYFIEDSHLTDYCKDLESVNYMDNSDTGVLFLEFPDRK